MYSSAFVHLTTWILFSQHAKLCVFLCLNSTCKHLTHLIIFFLAYNFHPKSYFSTDCLVLILLKIGYILMLLTITSDNAYLFLWSVCCNPLFIIFLCGAGKLRNIRYDQKSFMAFKYHIIWQSITWVSCVSLKFSHFTLLPWLYFWMNGLSSFEIWRPPI